MAHTLTDDRNRLAWGKVKKIIYVQMNLPLAFNASSSVDAAFVLDEDEEAEAPPLPSAWRDDADAADDSEAAAAAAAAAACGDARIAPRRHNGGAQGGCGKGPAKPWNSGKSARREGGAARSARRITSMTTSCDVSTPPAVRNTLARTSARAALLTRWQRGCCALAGS